VPGITSTPPPVKEPEEYNYIGDKMFNFISAVYDNRARDEAINKIQENILGYLPSKAFFISKLNEAIESTGFNITKKDADYVCLVENPLDNSYHIVWKDLSSGESIVKDSIEISREMYENLDKNLQYLCNVHTSVHSKEYSGVNLYLPSEKSNGARITVDKILVKLGKGEYDTEEGQFIEVEYDLAAKYAREGGFAFIINPRIDTFHMAPLIGENLVWEINSEVPGEVTIGESFYRNRNRSMERILNDNDMHYFIYIGNIKRYSQYLK
jgi:hypothetical protein